MNSTLWQQTIVLFSEVCCPNYMFSAHEYFLAFILGTAGVTERIFQLMCFNMGIGC